MSNLPSSIEVPDITVAGVTDGTLNGEGIFDKLMQSVNTHLLEQYASDRITSDTYGQVYLGAMQTVLAQAVQFELMKDKAAQDAALVLAQTLKTQKEFSLLDSQIALTDAQIANTEQQTQYNKTQETMFEYEKIKSEAETSLIGLQGTKISKDVEAVDAQIAKLVQDSELTAKEILKRQEEIDILIIQQDKIKAEVTYSEKQLDLIDSQILKSAAEVNLLNQKIITEQAQTTSGATGLVGAQVALYEAQAEGFAADAARKAVSAANDVYAIAKSNDPDDVEVPTNLISVLEAKLAAM